ncbi:MAG: PQQ-binding-like beta-propeller repeat protein [Pseudomonadota bacterium]
MSEAMNRSSRSGRRALTIVIVMLLGAAAVLLLVYTFRQPPKVTADSGELVEIELKDDFRHRWMIENEQGSIRGPRSDGERVYYLTREGASAVDGESGEALWTTGTAAWGDLALGEGLLAYGGFDRVVRAFDSVTGAEKWQFRTAELGAAPAIAPGLVLVGEAGGQLHALDAGTGAERWRLNIASPINWIAADSGFVAVVSQASEDTNTLTVARLDDGDVLWKQTDYLRYRSIAVEGGVVLAQGERVNFRPQTSLLTAYDAATGKVVWEKQASAFVSPFSVLEGALYLGSSGAEGTRLARLDPKTGVEAWSREVDPMLSPQTGAVADGLLYYGGVSGLFAASAASGEPAWRAGLRAGKPAAPVVAGDSLCFVADGGQRLYAIDLPSR